MEQVDVGARCHYHDDDELTLDACDYPIVLVFNGRHHYAPTTLINSHIQAEKRIDSSVICVNNALTLLRETVPLLMSDRERNSALILRVVKLESCLNAIVEDVQERRKEDVQTEDKKGDLETDTEGNLQIDESVDTDVEQSLGVNKSGDIVESQADKTAVLNKSAEFIKYESKKKLIASIQPQRKRSKGFDNYGEFAGPISSHLPGDSEQDVPAAGFGFARLTDRLKSRPPTTSANTDEMSTATQVPSDHVPSMSTSPAGDNVPSPQPDQHAERASPSPAADGTSPAEAKSPSAVRMEPPVPDTQRMTEGALTGSVEPVPLAAAQAEAPAEPARTGPVPRQPPPVPSAPRPSEKKKYVSF